MLLQDPENLGLDRGAHVADFVQEQAAAVGLLEAADSLAIGAGEGALLVAEQLRLEQRLGQRRAVHFDEVARRAVRVVMNRAGDELLARARLAPDQHGRVALRHLAHDAQHALQRLARADDAVEIVDVVLRVPQVVELVAHAPHLERLLDLHFHLFDLEGLLHVVERADLHRLDGRMHRSESGHQDDGGRRVQRLGRAQHIETVAAAHLQVAEHDVEVPFVKAFDRLVAVGSFLDLVVGGSQRPGEPASKGIVVVGDENAAHLFSYSGVPPPGSAAARGAHSPHALRRLRLVVR